MQTSVALWQRPRSQCRGSHKRASRNFGPTITRSAQSTANPGCRVQVPKKARAYEVMQANVEDGRLTPACRLPLISTVGVEIDSFLVVALPAAQGGGDAGDEGADHQR